MIIQMIEHSGWTIGCEHNFPRMDRSERRIDVDRFTRLRNLQRQYGRHFVHIETFQNRQARARIYMDSGCLRSETLLPNVPD